MKDFLVFKKELDEYLENELDIWRNIRPILEQQITLGIGGMWKLAERCTLAYKNK